MDQERLEGYLERFIDSMNQLQNEIRLLRQDLRPELIKTELFTRSKWEQEERLSSIQKTLNSYNAPDGRMYLQRRWYAYFDTKVPEDEVERAIEEINDRDKKGKKRSINMRRSLAFKLVRKRHFGSFSNPKAQPPDDFKYNSL